MKNENKEIRTAATIRKELDLANADLTTSTAKAARLEAAGDLSTVDELSRLTARAQLLKGLIKRLESELPAAIRAETMVEIERLQGVYKAETALAKAAAEKLTAAAVKLLVPAYDSHYAWSRAYCDRRAHEVGLMAQEHPVALAHTHAARDAKAEIARLEKIING